VNYPDPDDTLQTDLARLADDGNSNYEPARDGPGPELPGEPPVVPLPSPLPELPPILPDLTEFPCPNFKEC
jgi:hypothetical protein